jgi:Ni,Fe-hydrogenase III small subunit
VERFGMQLVGSPRHADVLLVNGSINKRDKPRLLEVYRQMAKPALVVAIGACGCTGGIFADGYPFAGPVDKIIPVDAYIPGCPPKPEAILAGIMKLVENQKKALAHETE